VSARTGWVLSIGVVTSTRTQQSRQPVSGFDVATFSGAEETLSCAFEEDPITSYLFPADTNRLKRLKFVFRVELLYASRHGVVETIGEGKAIAIWLPPGRTKGAFTAMVQSGAILAPFRLGLKAAWRVILLLRSIQELRLRLVSGDHWYLLGLGVHPQHQGQGWGSELVRHGLARAQSVELPCYLETTNQRNIVFYQRNGFRLVGDRPIARGGPTVWGMLCPSAA
jgi:ribosomal protein S18 acetylase RimI-like enzyme